MFSYNMESHLEGAVEAVHDCLGVLELDLGKSLDHPARAVSHEPAP